jgi:hypothetical protein
MKRFSEATNNILHLAGWFEGRDVLAQVRIPGGYVLFPAAREVLREFGNLHIGSVGPGKECATADVKIDPSVTEGGEECIAEFENKLGLKLFPLGEAQNGHFILFIDQQGRIFASWLLHDISLYAKSFDRALELLLYGIKGEEF